MTKGLRNKKIEQIESKNILDTVRTLNLDKVITEVSGLQVNVQNTLASLSAALTNKIQQIEQMDTAIDLKEHRLQELCGIENMAITLDEMKAQKEEEERKTSLQRQEKAKQWLEEEVERQKKWTRDQEDTEYNHALQHKKWTDEFNAEIATSKRNETTRQEILQKSWTDRETTIKTKEMEYNALRKQVDEFDAKLKTEIAKAETVLTNYLKKEHDHQVELLKKDTENKEILSNQKINAQLNAIQGLQVQIVNLQNQLSEARKDAKDVATQALQSASGRQVADALQRVVDSKDTGTTKTK